MTTKTVRHDEILSPVAVTSRGVPGATATPVTLAGGTALVAPTTGAHLKGEIVLSDNGAAWYCTAAGTPGTWIPLSKSGPRYFSITSSATPTINTDIYDMYLITALAVNITSMTTNLAGTPVEGQELWIVIVGTATRTIAWGTKFEASTTQLPTTTVGTNRLDIKFVWNSVSAKWRCLAVA